MQSFIRRLMLAVSVLLVACNKGPTAPPAVASITINAPNTTMQVGQTQQLTAVLKGSDGEILTGRTITWSSSDVSSASVSASGLVIALEPSSVTIAATSGGKSGAATITIPAPPTLSISLSSSKAFVGDSIMLTWASTNTVECVASGAWSGSKSTAGYQKVSRNVGGVTYFILACTGAAGSIKDSTRFVVPLPVLATSNANAMAYVITPLTATVKQVPSCGVDHLPVSSARAYADFLQDGTLTMVGNSLRYRGASQNQSAAPAGPICFLRQTANGSWSDITPQLLTDASGCVHSRKAVVADFNADKRPDVFIACHGYEGFDVANGLPGEVSFLLLSTPSGRYEKRALSIVAYTHGAAAGDINGDGFPDILFLNASRSATDVAYATFLINNGDGSFRRDDSRIVLPASVMCGSNPCQMYTAELIDVDRDGHLEAIIAGGDDPNPSRDFPITIFWGNSRGTFNDREPMSLPKHETCFTPLHIFLIGGNLFALRECNGYKGSALQRIALSSKTAETIWRQDHPYSVNGGTLYWLDWLFMQNGKLVHDWVFSLTIDP